jgi:hypothetical protein
MSRVNMTSDPVRDADNYMDEQQRLSDEAEAESEARQKELWLKLQTRDGAVQVDADFGLDVMYDMVALVAQWEAQTDTARKFPHVYMADVLLQIFSVLDKRIVEISDE